MQHISTFSKKAITIEEQIDLLKQRGLIVDDDACLRFLTNVSYYRTSWYFSAFQNSDDSFKPGTKFSKIKAVYITDQRIRNLIAEAIERIEIAFRARVVNITCCADNDPFWHVNNKKTQDIIQRRMTKKSRKNETDCPFIHYNKKYLNSSNTNHEYPFWIVSELFFFSDLSQIYSDGLSKEHKKTISLEFSLNPYKMASCLHSLTILRNTVAHHDKVFNRKFAKKAALPWIGSRENRLCEDNLFINHYYIICHFLSVIHPNNTWKARVDDLLAQDKDIAYGYGFTV